MYPLQVSTDFNDDPNVMAARNAAGTGIGSNCQIPRMGTRDSIGDIGMSLPPSPTTFPPHLTQGVARVARWQLTGISFDRIVRGGPGSDALSDLEG